MAGKKQVAKENKAKGKVNDVSASKSKSKVDTKTPVKPPAKVDPPAKKIIIKEAAKQLTKKTTPAKIVSPPKKDTTAPKRGAPVTAVDAKDTKDVTGDKKITKTKSEEQIVKVITKGGAAVDSFVQDKDSYRVFQEGGKSYGATLNQSNLDHNNNKFYIVQVLVKESTGAIYVFNRWGRVGVPGQFALKGPFPKEAAIKEYNSKHHEKTVKGDYKEIQIKYDDEEEQKDQKKVDKSSTKKEVASKIDQGLQKLINLIFDVNLMNSTMKQIGYDAKRMPLGKLGDTTIKEAYVALNNLSEAIKKKDTSQYKKLSSQFYTLIPHDFGFQNMANFVLDNDEKVKEKVKMLETISDLKITSKLLDQKTNDEASILDQNYKKLGCDIKTVDTKSSEYKLLQEYFDNTKGCYNKVQIGEIYQIYRPNEQKEYNTKLGNNMLLWHGSRVSNFVGILSQGLRIAPPEAPVSGYLFGKGIYLADMAEKSINYCRAHGSDTALILLIQGAIGNPNVLTNTNCSAKEEMIKQKKDSTKCHGSKAPPPESYVKHKEIIVPKGVAKPTGSGSYMGHNEYIVYNMSQARIRYVIRMDMKGQ